MDTIGTPFLWLMFAGVVVVALLVSLWVLPGLVAALTPIRARDGEAQTSLAQRVATTPAMPKDAATRGRRQRASFLDDCVQLR